MAAVAVPVGTFTIIKCIKKLTHHPVNTLHRRADIELVDFINPTQPPNSFQIDLENYNLPYINWNSVYPPSYWSGNLPSYRSEILPLYENGYNIHCCLENEYMNIYFIIFSIFLTLYLFLKNVNFSPLINKKSDDFNTRMNLIPFSVFNIDFRDSFEWELKHGTTKPIISYLMIQNLTNEIQSLLNSLNLDVNYSMSLYFISSYSTWKNDKENQVPLFVDNAIIINKESDSILITQFIMNVLDEKGYFISKWLFKDSTINSIDPIILSAIVPINVKI
jgi:hypothetical protein